MLLKRNFKLLAGIKTTSQPRSIARCVFTYAQLQQSWAAFLQPLPQRPRVDRLRDVPSRHTDPQQHQQVLFWTTAWKEEIAAAQQHGTIDAAFVAECTTALREAQNALVALRSLS